jgi:poly(A) polymerase
MALASQPRFRAGYDFLRLRADALEVDADLADWWEDFALGDADEREALLQVAREAERTRRQGEPAGPSPGSGEAPRKRRRRRRRSAGSRDEAAASADPLPRTDEH